MAVIPINRIKKLYLLYIVIGLAGITILSMTSAVFYQTKKDHLALKTTKDHLALKTTKDNFTLTTRWGNLTIKSPIQEKLSNYTRDSDGITLVTAYFDLGTFQKGETNYYYSKKMYFRLAKTYEYIENPLVCYTDSKSFIDHMTTLRKGKEHKTKILYIERNSSWAFQLQPRIEQVISQPEYPIYHPNTVMPEYLSAMFAKYDVMKRAAKADYFKTKYIAWIDIGHFRIRRNSRKARRKFELVKLDSHNESGVAMSKIYNVPFDVSPKTIFLKNLVWVGGAFVFGERERIIKFADQFKAAVDFFLSQNIINSDQQVLYAIYSNEGRETLKPEVEIQCSQAGGWFGLGTKMIKELEQNHNWWI